MQRMKRAMFCFNFRIGQCQQMETKNGFVAASIIITLVAIAGLPGIDPLCLKHVGLILLGPTQKKSCASHPSSLHQS